MTTGAAPAVRTVWVTNDFPPRSGGIEQFVANLLARCEPSSVRVVTGTQPGGVPFDEELPYPVARVAPRPLLPTPWLAARVRAEVTAFDAQAVVFGAAWPLAEMAGAIGVPCAALTHGHEAGMARVGGGPLLRHAFRSVGAIGVISDFTQRHLTRWVPPRTRVHRIPPGVDIARFHPDVSGDTIRRRYGLHAQQPLVLCLSRLVPRKGQDVLIEAWPDVLRLVPDAHLLLAGTGPSEVALRRSVTRLRLDANVTFAGDVPAAELPAFHAAADVFAMPCRTRHLGLDVEGLGIVFLEAQACATPVVAGNSGGAPEALLDGESGAVVDGRAVPDVAAAVVRFLHDPQGRAQMGAAGRRFVAQNYAWEVISERFGHMLEQLVTTKRP